MSPQIDPSRALEFQNALMLSGSDEYPTNRTWLFASPLKSTKISTLSLVDNLNLAMGTGLSNGPPSVPI